MGFRAMSSPAPADENYRGHGNVTAAAVAATGFHSPRLRSQARAPCADEKTVVTANSWSSDGQDTPPEVASTSPLRIREDSGHCKFAAPRLTGETSRAHRWAPLTAVAVVADAQASREASRVLDLITKCVRAATPAPSLCPPALAEWR